MKTDTVLRLIQSFYTKILKLSPEIMVGHREDQQKIFIELENCIENKTAKRKLH